MLVTVARLQLALLQVLVHQSGLTLLWARPVHTNQDAGRDHKGLEESTRGFWTIQHGGDETAGDGQAVK